ncbi:hypothetical protein G7048_27030 (plasmid) [Diaphorobacter sp. HDW4B]|uniref:YqiA/YcfP family alpha/beta fold hydrolase n=1 Tax=Diaphorobacter sp. HDW4B TaxID=2714925 RepID=UPI00140C47BF|nr:YqiA/YcfP family alpha/beta fold hydrolase [Diaphorobacter sp. HDW4B]QIL74137.1 hypothetical protein G7048_27030 [Diaphorobacter sp. HDW4B]
MGKILYIHRHGSSGNSEKTTSLKAALESLGHTVFIPTHHSDPRIDLPALAHIVQSERISAVIGSSLGGLYSLLLSGRYDTKAFLINPSLRPELTVFRDHPERAGMEAALSHYKPDSKDQNSWPDTGYSEVLWANVKVAIAMDDERIDVPRTVKELRHAQILQFHDKRGHQFKNVLDLVPHIVELIGQ